MAFRIFAFHFDPAYDATGFLGWLHADLARATGADHIVVCGRSSRAGGDHTRGGIFEPTICMTSPCRGLSVVRALFGCATART